MSNETRFILFSIVLTAACAFIGITVFRYRFGKEKFWDDSKPLTKRMIIWRWVIVLIIIGIIITFIWNIIFG